MLPGVDRCNDEDSWIVEVSSKEGVKVDTSKKVRACVRCSNARSDAQMLRWMRVEG